MLRVVAYAWSGVQAVCLVAAGAVVLTGIVGLELASRALGATRHEEA